MQTGIVIRNDGPRYWVDIDGAEIPCTLRGRMKREQQRITSLVVVGDQVKIEQFSDGTGVIHEVQERRSELSRPGFAGYVHVIAANVDQLVVVQAARQPAFKLGLRSRLQGRISVLAGQSGVGKSSLINSLYPEAAARTTHHDKQRLLLSARRRVPGGYAWNPDPGAL